MEQIDSLDGLLEVVDPIDIDEIGQEASENASNMMKDLLGVFVSEGWSKENPQKKKRLDIELENLRYLLKMRILDEKIHNSLIRGLNDQPANGSLYRALADIQKTSLSITDKINATHETISNLIKEWGAEMIQENNNSIGDDDNVSITRGTKEFIINMVS